MASIQLETSYLGRNIYLKPLLFLLRLAWGLSIKLLLLNDFPEKMFEEEEEVEDIHLFHLAVLLLTTTFGGFTSSIIVVPEYCMLKINIRSFQKYTK